MKRNNKSNFQKNTDLLLFAFTYTNMQKNLGNSHTQLKIKNKVLYDIDVKKKYLTEMMCLKTLNLYRSLLKKN